MSLSPSSRIGKRLLHLVSALALLALIGSFTNIQVAQAAVTDIACDEAELEAAVIIANSNGEADTLNLAAGCTYLLPDTLFIEDDSGNPLVINGNGATLFGNGAVSVIENCCGTVTLNNLTIENGGGDVGGIANLGGTLTINNSTLVGNFGVGGGGILNETGQVTLNNVTITGNGGLFGGAVANLGGTVTLNNSSMTGNGGLFGGAVANFGGTVTLNSSSVTGNEGLIGGGIVNLDMGTPLSMELPSAVSAALSSGLSSSLAIASAVPYSSLTLNNSTVAGNTTLGGGTSIGGGIVNAGGAVSLNNSTISGNNGGAAGGGIYNALGTISLTNSTVSGNISSDAGGGILNDAGQVTLNNVTITGNDAAEGGGLYNEAGTVTIANTIIANSLGGDCANYGTMTPAGNNLVSDGSCGFPVGGDPMLGALTGGPAYHPLLAGSPAIDAGDDSLCPATDQRGAARPQDGDLDGTAACDLGAYEADTPDTPQTPAPTLAMTPTRAPTMTPPPPPDTPLCEDHNFAVGGVVRSSTRDGLDYAINCRILYQNGRPTTWLGSALYDSGSIGNEGIMNLGVQQAVDIFSPVGMTYFDGGAVFCLRGQGTLIWLAASGAPRHAEIIDSYTVDEFPGFTCVTLFEPGTLVLVRDTPR